MKQKLSKSTPFLGIPLWVLLVASTAAFIAVVTCVFLCIYFICYPRRKSYKPHFSLPKSIACKHYSKCFSSSSLDRRLLSVSGNLSEMQMNFEMLSGHQWAPPDQFSPQVDGITKDGYLTGLESSGKFYPEAKDVTKGRCNFGLKEIEDATNGLARENVIGSGGYGVVYLGLLSNNRRVAVKRLVCDGQPEDFASQMEAVGRVKHKNVVKLLGYCTEGAYRIAVSEYVDNGNLHHWLHEFTGQVSPLTWTIRLNIIHGVAKGLACLHETVEQKILHGRIKSTNILLDRQWNPKISDFGLIKLLSPEWSHIVTRTLGYSGYVASDCHSTSTFTEGNDIHGFGTLIMEIVSGWIPFDHSQPQAHLVYWFKSMIASGKIAYVVDPKLPAKPSSKELKRIILVALRCVDSDVNPRLKMGDVISMLETRNMFLPEEHQIAREPFEYNHSLQSHTPARFGDSPLKRNRRLSSINNYQKMAEK